MSKWENLEEGCWYYLQNKSQGYVGNSLLWWALNGRGYTCDIRCAEVWTKQSLMKRNPTESKYKAYRKDVIDRLVQHHIDMQDLEHKDNDGNFRQKPHSLLAYNL